MKTDRRKPGWLLRFIAIVAFVVLAAPATLSNDTTVVERFGLIRTQGNKIVDKDGNPVVLRGMSLFWSQWMPQFYNFDCVRWLRDDWKCTVVRAAMGIESGGYLTNPTIEKARVKAVIDACIALGIYVIVDWHDHNAQNHRAEAIGFFQEIASQYGTSPNLIYEIYNEPQQVSWTGVVKPYADSVVQCIRAIDPDNLIIVGTPTWSQDVDVASLTPLSYSNVAYALHFYAATHKQALRNKAATALNRGVALFVTEFGTCESSGTGILDSVEVDTWMKFMSDNQLSWCNWSIADKSETSAALIPGASGSGGWPASALTRSGSMIRDIIRTGNELLLSAVTLRTESPDRFALFQNYPNPFNPTTEIQYIIPVGTRPRQGSRGKHAVSLQIYDLLGREVATLVNEKKEPGRYSVWWSPNNLSGGVYLSRLMADEFIQTRKMIFLK